MLHFLVGSFGIDSVLLIDGSIMDSESMLKDLGVTSLIIRGRPTSPSLGGRGGGVTPMTLP